MKNNINEENVKNIIYKRFNKPYVLSSGDEISVYDLISAIRCQKEPYDIYFYKKVRKDISKINVRSMYKNLGIIKYKYPIIQNINLGIDESGLISMELECNDFHRGPIRIVYGESSLSVPKITVISEEKEVDVEPYNNFLRSISKKINSYRFYLQRFKDEFKFNGVSWSTDSKRNNTPAVIDGEVYWILDSKNSRYDAYSYGYRNDNESDMLDQYFSLNKEELSKKSSINICDLDPLTKRVVEKHFGLDKQQKLKKN